MSEEHLPAQGSGSSEAEINEKLQTLLSPLGSAQHLRARERAAHFLLAHADQSHPRLLAALRANPTGLKAPAIIEVLPLFAHEESVPLLEEVMALGAELVSRSAGLALGRHPSKNARQALLQGLRSALPEIVIAAADGLSVRADDTSCGALRDLVKHEDPTVRNHVIQAAIKLQCFGRSELANLSEDEADEDVRALVQQTLSGMSG